MFSYTDSLFKVNGFQILIQSETYSAQELQERIYLYVEDEKKRVSSLSDEMFGTMTQALI